MGFYINPRDGSDKEKWLHDKHVSKSWTPPKEPTPAGHHYVVWVDNGWMTAAGVAYTQDELERFAYPGDDRPKIYFLCKDEDILEQVPELAHRMD